MNLYKVVSNPIYEEGRNRRKGEKIELTDERAKALGDLVEPVETKEVSAPNENREIKKAPKNKKAPKE